MSASLELGIRDPIVADVDLHIGRRLRRRRRMLGLTQEALAQAVGIRFQQVQKYECAANRVCAARLHDFARALGVSVDYFFEGLSGGMRASEEPTALQGGLACEAKTLELARAFAQLTPSVRQELLGLVRALAEPDDPQP